MLPVIPFPLIMRVHFTKRIKEKDGSLYAAGLPLSRWDRESITFIKDLDPRLVPKKGEFTIGNNKYRYWGEIPRLRPTTKMGTVIYSHYLEVIVEEING